MSGNRVLVITVLFLALGLGWPYLLAGLLALMLWLDGLPTVVWAFAIAIAGFLALRRFGEPRR